MKPVLRSEELEGYVLWRQQRKVRGMGMAKYALVYATCCSGELVLRDFETGELNI